jgi:hypothetical protein
MLVGSADDSARNLSTVADHDLGRGLLVAIGCSTNHCLLLFNSCRGIQKDRLNVSSTPKHSTNTAVESCAQAGNLKPALFAGVKQQE